MQKRREKINRRRPTLNRHLYLHLYRVPALIKEHSMHGRILKNYSSHEKCYSWFAWIESPLKYTLLMLLLGWHRCQLYWFFLFFFVAVTVVAFIDCARFSFYFCEPLFSILCQTAAGPSTKRKKDSIPLWIPLCWSLFCLNKYSFSTCNITGEVSIPESQAFSYQCTYRTTHELCGAWPFLTMNVNTVHFAIRFANVDFKSIYLFSFHFTFYFCAKIVEFIIRTFFFTIFASSQTLPLYFFYFLSVFLLYIFNELIIPQC